MDELCRLHITPLYPDTLPVILGPVLYKFAANISYHTIQTCPENSYGYVDIPKMEAGKLKKKMNGAIVKGKKIKVEEARPEKRKHEVTDSMDTPSQTKISSTQRSRKAKKDSGVIQGHELSPERKIKRGWTKPKAEKHKKQFNNSPKDKSSKAQAASKYSEKEELLFRTQVTGGKTNIDGQNGRRTRGSKKYRTGDVVHEFEKSTIVPSFLRDEVPADPSSPAQYKDGEGWIDSNGQVLEQETDRASRKRKAAKLGLAIDVDKAEQSNHKKKRRSPSATADKLSATASAKEIRTPATPPSDNELPTAKSIEFDDTEETSSAGGSSPESTSQGEEDEGPEGMVSSPTSAQPDIQTTLAEIPSITVASETDVHPLEALFKKPRLPGPISEPDDKHKPSLELKTSFSFFDGEEDADSDEGDKSDHSNSIALQLPPLPMTPFTSQDFRRRGIRSAAPTPDTADPRKSLGYGSVMLGEDDPDDELSDLDDAVGYGDGEDGDSRAGPTSAPSATNGNNGSSLQIPQSDFEKRFWEKRGENNRAWKARRRAVLKEKRQRENRARRPRDL